MGEQRFPARRLLLCAQCEHFRQRLDPAAAFADGASAPELTLPDADPGAFEVALHFMYTDEVLRKVQKDGMDGHEQGGSGPGLAMLQAVGELADRLLLPRLCELLTPLMLARVDAGGAAWWGCCCGRRRGRAASGSRCGA